MTLGNIPRLYTALADWIACMLCISLFPHRLKGWQLRAVQAFFLAVMCVFLAATGDVPVAWFVPPASGTGARSGRPGGPGSPRRRSPAPRWSR